MILNSKNSKDSLTDQFKDCISQGIQQIESKIDYLSKIADESIPKVEKVYKCTSFDNRKSMSYYERHDEKGNYIGYFTNNNWKRVVEIATNNAEKLLKNDEDVHFANIPSIENNIEIINKIKLIMSKIGIQPTYTTYEYKNSRSRTRTEITHQAGYLSDLHRCIPTDDGYSLVKSAYNDYINEIKRYKEEKEKEEQQKKQKLDEENKTKEKGILLGKYIAEYGLDINATEYDILSAILDKNKYLRLAHFLYKNRNDWTDGYSYAETGLNGFNPETQEDKDIYDTLTKYIGNWDGDGRIFRDSEYGYHYLFAKVPKELYQEYIKFTTDFPEN